MNEQETRMNNFAKGLQEVWNNNSETILAANEGDDMHREDVFLACVYIYLNGFSTLSAERDYYEGISYPEQMELVKTAFPSQFYC